MYMYIIYGCIFTCTLHMYVKAFVIDLHVVKYVNVYLTICFSFAHSVVPHISDAIQEWVERVARIPVGGGTPQVCVIEVRIGNSFCFFLQINILLIRCLCKYP